MFQHSLNYPSERNLSVRQQHGMYRDDDFFLCDWCGQGFWEPDDGNMEWLEFGQDWRCGKCIDNYGIGSLPYDQMTITFN